MTQEEKQLLLIDICARLPYGLYVRINEIHCLDKNEAITEGFIGGYCKPNMCQDYSLDEIYEFLDEDDVKPYLRPMSSMTEKEKEFYTSMFIEYDGGYFTPFPGTVVDWLNKNMFDYHGLIPMGLALEATKDMYKTE